MPLETLIMNAEEEALFLGNLLGDGHLQKRGRSYRTKIHHSIQQKDYVLWKYEKLKRFCGKNQAPKLITSKHHQQSFEFYLNSGFYLEKYHKLFYEPYFWKSPLCEDSGEKVRYRKVVSPAVIEFLPRNPLLLAIWFLDDGSCRKDVFSGRLATQGFSKEEQFLLQQYLKEGFEINTQLVLHDRIKKHYYLSIPASKNQFSNFVDLIKPIVDEIPSLKYKIQNPRND